MKISIINLGINNIKSVVDFFSQFGDVKIIESKDSYTSSDVLVFPGNGSFKTGSELMKKKKFDILINDLINSNTKIITICLGTQLLFEFSDESKNYKNIKILSGKVIKIETSSCRLPLLGWYDIVSDQNYLNKKSFFFNNNFYCKLDNNSEITSKVIFDDFELTASIKKNNIYGFQFHPEKSSVNGYKLIKEIINE